MKREVWTDKKIEHSNTKKEKERKTYIKEQRKYNRQTDKLKENKKEVCIDRKGRSINMEK